MLTQTKTRERKLDELMDQKQDAGERFSTLEALSRGYQKEINSALFDQDEVDEVRYKHLKEQKLRVDQECRRNGIEPA